MIAPLKPSATLWNKLVRSKHKMSFKTLEKITPKMTAYNMTAEVKLGD